MVEQSMFVASRAAVRAWAVSVLSLGAIAQSPAIDEPWAQVEAGLLPAAVAADKPLPVMTLRERMLFYGVPAVSVAVVAGSKLTWAHAWGEIAAGSCRAVTTETLFQAASISKPVTTVLALDLVEDGALGLDTDVGASLKGWRIPANEFTEQQPVLLRHILTHTAGFTNHAVGTYAVGAPLPTLLQALAGEPPALPRPIKVDFTPGSRFRYAGGGFTVLQLLLEETNGASFAEAAAKRLLQPLGMTHSTFAQPLPPNLTAQAAHGHRSGTTEVAGGCMVLPESAAGGLWTTPSDLAALIVGLQRAHAGEPWILAPATVREMLRTQFEQRGFGVEVGGDGDERWFSHGGSNPGYRCTWIGYVTKGCGAVVMTNSDRGAELAREVVRAVATVDGWPGHGPKRYPVVAVDAAGLAALAGDFAYTESRSLRVRVEGGRLYARETREADSELLPLGGDRFVSELYDHELTFRRDESGKATEVAIRWDGGASTDVGRRKE